MRKNKDNARLQFKKWKLEEVAAGGLWVAILALVVPLGGGQVGGGGGEDKHQNQNLLRKQTFCEDGDVRLGSRPCVWG